MCLCNVSLQMHLCNEGCVCGYSLTQRVNETEDVSTSLFVHNCLLWYFQLWFVCAHCDWGDNWSTYSRPHWGVCLCVSVCVQATLTNRHNYLKMRLYSRAITYEDYIRDKFHALIHMHICHFYKHTHTHCSWGDLTRAGGRLKSCFIHKHTHTHIPNNFNASGWRVLNMDAAAYTQSVLDTQSTPFNKCVCIMCVTMKSVATSTSLFQDKEQVKNSISLQLQDAHSHSHIVHTNCFPDANTIVSRGSGSQRGNHRTFLWHTHQQTEAF